MNNRTPGPWRYGSTLGYGLAVFGPAEVGSPDHIVAVASDNRDNARLIAAAPDMLEALRAITSFNSGHTSLDCSKDTCVCGWTLARNAIVRAGGLT